MNQLSITDLQRHTGSAARCDATELADPVSVPALAAAPIGIKTDAVCKELVDEFRLTKILEEARLLSDASGAAVALARGAKMVCLATSGPDAPDLGADFTLGNGLSGCCMQTRQLQQCNDTETDPRVDAEACRFLGVRSVVVFPLMEAGELFGVFEIFSSRANAFGQSHLLRLQALADRISGFGRQHGNAPTTVPSKDCGLDSAEPAVSVKRNSKTRRRQYQTACLVAALIALSVLLGWMMGRAGWDTALNQAQSEISTPAEPVNDLSAQSIEMSTQATNNLVNPAGSVNPKQQDPVVINVLIGTDGSVRELKLISGDPQLMEAVSDAVRQWHFKPHRLNHQLVEFETRIIVKFAPP